MISPESQSPMVLTIATLTDILRQMPRGTPYTLTLHLAPDGSASVLLNAMALPGEEASYHLTVILPGGIATLLTARPEFAATWFFAVAHLVVPQPAMPDPSTAH